MYADFEDSLQPPNYTNSQSQKPLHQESPEDEMITNTNAVNDHLTKNFAINFQFQQTLKL